MSPTPRLRLSWTCRQSIKPSPHGCKGPGIRAYQRRLSIGNTWYSTSCGALEEWRGRWSVGALTCKKRQEQVIGCLWFCERAGWFERSCAREITTGVSATYIYSDCPSVDKHN